MKLVVVSLLIVLLFRKGISHGDETDSTICPEMMTYSNNGTTSICSSDYLIITETPNYEFGQSILVTIRGITPDITFTDVVLLARDNNNTIVGTWTTNDPLLRIISCPGVIHNSNVDKNRVQAIWHVPSNLIGNIKIQATIAKNEKTIFVNCYNVILIPHVNNDSTPIPATEPLNTTIVTLSSTTVTQTPSPTADVGVNVTWTFDSNNITRIHMVVVNMQAAQWAAIGLSLDGSMGPSHVFICRRLANNTVDVNRYINSGGHARPVPAGSEQGGTFTVEQQMFNNGLVICQFTLSNFHTTTITNPKDIQKLSQSTPYHPLFAIGQLDASNVLKKHADDSHISQPRFVQLNRAESITFHITPSQDDDKTKLLKAHGSLMVFTWLLVVSTGIIFARYFKNSWPKNTICGKNIWFSVHRFLMSAAAILTLLGFMFVLVYNNGQWVKEDHERSHAIVGVIVIGLAFFQPFIALFRCEPNSRHRFLFNVFHAIVGVAAFILSITTLFLATINFKGIFPTSTGRALMSVWVCWIVLISIAFEYFKRREASTESALNGDNPSNSTAEDLGTSSFPLLANRGDQQQQRLKNILLILHLFVATGLSIALIVIILKFD